MLQFPIGPRSGPFSKFGRTGLRIFGGAVAALVLSCLCARSAPESTQPTVKDLMQKLWPKERVEQALQSLERQKADGLLSQAAYEKRKQMLEARLAGSYQPQSLSVADPPLNFIQNGGFEQTNPNSAKNRSRWLWWGGWSWGGDYENMWEDKAEFVHSGKLSARIRCTGAKGRIGLNTPPLPAVPGATEYKLVFWAKGEGDNMLFINFEEGASGSLREKVPGEWTRYTVSAKPVSGKNTYNVFVYVIGGGTIWLDNFELAPVGGKLDE